MKITNKDNPRELIPRIRDYKTTAALGELDALAKESKSNFIYESGEIERKQKEWRTERSISYAADLLNSAIVTNNKEVAYDVANFILESGTKSTSNPLLFSLANSVLNEERVLDFDKPILLKDDIINNIRELKQILNSFPRNSIAWCELSRLYVLMKQYPKAIDALQNAIRITPNNRYVIRTAIGMYVHFNEPDHAKYILNKSDIIKFDPWLIASDIVLSEMVSKTSRVIVNGKRLLDSNNYSNKSLTELTSALATLELASGKSKKAKNLYALSLKDPTDNTLAQAIWATSLDNNVVEMRDICYINVPLDYEAKFYQFQKLKELDKALIQVNKWINDQPFSKEAYYNGSYVAAVGLRKYTVAENLLKRGLEYTTNDFLMLNNLTFSYLQQNKIVEAEETYKKLSLAFNNDVSESNTMVYTATSGLLYYKQNNYEMGRQKYEEAIRIAKNKGFRTEEGLCKIYLAIEEFGINSNNFTKFYEDAINTCKQIDDIEVINELNYLKQLVK